jgi:hypothetical protein
VLKKAARELETTHNRVHRHSRESDAKAGIHLYQWDYGFRLTALPRPEWWIFRPSGIFQQPVLMFVFKRSDTIIYSAVAGSIVDECTLPETGKQDPKTPVEQALMRGLDTA